MCVVLHTPRVRGVAKNKVNKIIGLVNSAFVALTVTTKFSIRAFAEISPGYKHLIPNRLMTQDKVKTSIAILCENA